MKSKKIIHRLYVCFLRFFLKKQGESVARKGNKIFIQKEEDLIDEDYVKISDILQELVSEDVSVVEIYLDSKGGHAHSTFFQLCDELKRERLKRTIRTFTMGNTIESAAAMIFILGSAGERYLRNRRSKIRLHGPLFYFFPIGVLYDEKSHILQFPQEESAGWIAEIEFYLSTLEQHTKIPEQDRLKSIRGVDLEYSGREALGLKVADGYL